MEAEGCAGSSVEGEIATRCEHRASVRHTSSNLSESIGNASGTRRGSAVYTPSTFFHMVILDARMSFAKIVAE